MLLTTSPQEDIEYTVRVLGIRTKDGDKDDDDEYEGKDHKKKKKGKKYDD